MIFKQLHIGQKFNFDHTGLPNWGGENGPWVKLSARKYRKDTTPFSLDPVARNDHVIYSQLICTVGTVKVGVIPIQ